MLICATLPLALVIGACTGDDGPSGTGDETTGISTLPTGDGDGDQTGDGDGDPTTTTGDGDGDQTGDGDGDDTGPDCGSVEITPTYIPPNVMLVVDASGSMISNSWDHDLDPNTPVETRWKTLYNVVDSVMTQFGPAMNAGIQRFPSEDACPNWTQQSSNCYNSGACVVGTQPEVGVALDNGAGILAAIPGPDAVAPDIVGGTPATKGINSAVDHLLTQDPTNPNYILLVTDGAANCNDALGYPTALETYDETLPTTVAAAFNDNNIPTFVVGIDIVNMLTGVGADGSPEANPFERLNDVAVAGGVPKNGGMDAEKFFNSTNQDELLTALSQIIDEITECSITLDPPPAPIQVPFVSFTSNGMDVPFLEDPADCATMDGWTWIEEGVSMTFCGSYCDDFKGGGATFDGTYGCPPAG